MSKDNSKNPNKNIPIISMSENEREEAWDNLFIKEEGSIIEFNQETKTGKIKSLKDGNIYSINSRELIKTKIELRSGDKILFAPMEDPEGKDYARVIRIVDFEV